MKYPAKEVYKNDKVVNSYDEQRFKTLKGRIVDSREKLLIYKALSLTGITKESKILDIPCGTGRLSFFLAEKGYNIIGCDISPTMIKKCNEKKINYNNKLITNRVNFKISDAEHLDFSDNSFDVVISLRLFGHLPPEIRKKVLNEMRRVSNSFVIVAYYNKYSLQNLIRKKFRISNNIKWYPTSLNEIDSELRYARLRRIGRLFLMPFFSETVIIIAKKF